MKLILLSNLLTPHQVELCHAFSHMEELDEFYFIETIHRDSTLPIGWSFQGEVPPYVISYERYLSEKEMWDHKIFSADAVVLGSAPYSLVRKRLSHQKLTFAYSERVYKNPCPVWQIPLRAVKYFWKLGRHKALYLLCASAYTASDYAKTRTFIGKAYKWGYFPKLNCYPDIDRMIELKHAASILWVARLIELKHPEVPIRLAKKLKEEGYSFNINIIGTGEMERAIHQMIARYGVMDCVHMLGSMTPEMVREYMEQSQIFLFTSDRNEGWGAVLNESMNSGCAVVANRAIGSVPYLLKHGENGLIYDSEEDLYPSVKILLDDHQKRMTFGREAYRTIKEEWNAETAAKRLLCLVDEINTHGTCTLFEAGVCSKDG